MDKIKSLSEKRLIIEGIINNKKAYFLCDTGASIGILDETKKKKYDLKEGRKFNGQIVGAGGAMKSAHICDTVVKFNNRTVGQFLLNNISSVRDSIFKETGYEILGIIGLPQMKILNMQFDLNDNLIIFE